MHIKRLRAMAVAMACTVAVGTASPSIGADINPVAVTTTEAATTAKKVPSKVTLNSAKLSGTNKVTVSWKKASNATEYRIYYKEGNGSWKQIATVKSGTSYTHKSSSKYPLKAGKTYKYTVKAYNSKSKKTGSYDTKGKSVTIPLVPATVKLASAKAEGTNKITVKWNKASNANKYIVYYKTGNSGWKKLKETTGTSFTHTGLKAGTKYTYTVKGYNNKYKTNGSYNTTGLSATTNKATVTPGIIKLNSAKANGSNKITITWTADKNATSYIVYYRRGYSGWIKLKETTSTSFTHTGLDSEAKYTYIVVGYNSKYKTTGKWNASIYATTGAESSDTGSGSTTTPTQETKLTPGTVHNVSATANGENSITVKWDKTSNADKYYVYYKTGTSGWQKISETTGTSFTHTGLSKGTEYKYAVRGYNNKYKTLGDYDHDIEVYATTQDNTSYVLSTWITDKKDDKYVTIGTPKTIGFSWSATGNTTRSDFTYKSSDESVATVDDNGVITGLKYGKVTITITPKEPFGKQPGAIVFGDTTGAVTVTYNVQHEYNYEIGGRAFIAYPCEENGANDSYSVDYHGRNIDVGETVNHVSCHGYITKDDEVSKEDIKKYVTFTSSDPSVATIDEYGNITGVSKGYVTFTWKSKLPINAEGTRYKEGSVTYHVGEYTYDEVIDGLTIDYEASKTAHDILNELRQDKSKRPAVSQKHPVASAREWCDACFQESVVRGARNIICVMFKCWNSGENTYGNSLATHGAGQNGYGSAGWEHTGAELGEAAETFFCDAPHAANQTEVTDKYSATAVVQYKNDAGINLTSMIVTMSSCSYEQEVKNATASSRLKNWINASIIGTNVPADQYYDICKHFNLTWGMEDQTSTIASASLDESDLTDELLTDDDIATTENAGNTEEVIEDVTDDSEAEVEVEESGESEVEIEKNDNASEDSIDIETEE